MCKTFWTKHSALSQFFLLEQLDLEGQWEFSISDNSYPSLYQSFTEENFMFFFSQNHQTRRNKFCLEPDLHYSITNNVEAMKTLIQEKHNQKEVSIAVKNSQTTQNVEIRLANQRLGYILFYGLGTKFWKQFFSMTLLYCWEQKDAVSQSLLLTLFGYIFSGLTQT